MKHSLILSVGSFLIACLVLATSAAGYFQAAHEIARAGQTTFVICGQDGLDEVTLDQNGVPVEPAKGVCGHCADCSLISSFDLPIAVAFPRRATQPQQASRSATETILISRPAIKMPRAPPSKAII
jgi:hypothetical protein